MEYTEDNTEVIEKFEKIEKNNSNLKIAVGILALLFLGSGGYFYMKTKLEAEKLAFVENDRSTITQNLIKKTEELNTEISKNADQQKELEAKRQEIVDLINQVNSGKATISKLQAYKRQAEVLQSRMDSMMQEIADLRRENQTLRISRDSSVAALKSLRSVNGTGTGIVTGPNGFNNKNKVESTGSTGVTVAASGKKGGNMDLAEKLYRLDIAGFNAQAVNGSGAPTQNASDADQINLTYKIPQSFIVRASERPYYIQVTNPENKVLGENSVATFEDGVNLNYSSIKKVDYKNRVMPVSENLKYSNLKKGKYTVKIFDKSRLVGTKEFILK